MDFIFLGAGAANGYDQLGHFLRTEGVGGGCVKYFITPNPSCNRKLGTTSAAQGDRSAASSQPARRAGDGADARRHERRHARQAIAKYPGTPAPGETPGRTPASTGSSGGAASSTQPVGGSTAGHDLLLPVAESPEADGMLLNYLLGN